MNLQTITQNENSHQEFLGAKLYSVTYRQKFGSCFIYRNEIMMGISINAVRKLAELLLQPGETISHIKDVYSLLPASLNLTT
ncbi:hypothetical protein [Anabaena sp. UHCC 0187]|uniref:hypothetical protein n=1 Tax=Anabaena sp. UHCC 0187 TaxID=2590018 RepID=UPI001C2BAA27|nr:hypothetical protein [Anabaena sp. UHCC 0187]